MSVSKLDYQGERTALKADEATPVLVDILHSYGCAPEPSSVIAEHLVDSDLSGVESHGVMRILQYARQFEDGYMTAKGTPYISDEDGSFITVDGRSGHGIPAMKLAYDAGCTLAAKIGISATSIVNVGHTGRHGAFADNVAERGFVSI